MAAIDARQWIVVCLIRSSLLYIPLYLIISNVGLANSWIKVLPNVKTTKDTN
jgi:ABC-type glycerol-3-phosphate transport system permease component